MYNYSDLIDTSVFLNYQIPTSTHPHINQSPHPHINKSLPPTYRLITISINSQIFTSINHHITTSINPHINTSSHHHINTSTNLHINTSPQLLHQYLSVEKINNPVSKFSITLAVRHHYYSSTFLVQFPEQVHYFNTILRIKVTCWLIGKD